MRVLLVNTYDLGHQPFGLASPAAWLARAGHTVVCADLAVEPMPNARFDRVAFHLPMHTATRLAAPLIEQLRGQARIACYGLYAPLNAEYLRSLGAEAIIGGEFEAALVDWVNGHVVAEKHLDRLEFIAPQRQLLPVLDRYAKLQVNGESRTVGYTEASRGCKHLCRHCPVVPVYEGRFRVVPVEVVLQDIRQQVAAGARHITFGDPDFWNGPTHARRIVQYLHAEFPALTYDVTIKVEHLLAHRDLLAELKATGCLMVTSAVESLDDAVLQRLEKGHTRADFELAVDLLRAAGLTLAPTFIAFTPWTTRASYLDLLRTLAGLDLVENVAPVQLALRLLIPSGSRLLELSEVRELLTGYDQQALLHRWQHPDPAIDELAAAAIRLAGKKRSRQEGFAALWQLAGGGEYTTPALPARASIPYLDEPWYC
ncbi:MAG: radical SAM protein [Bryobacteraceae bacterium]|nr:radical SAM protein [Bryobacteraceae bacterium]